MAHYYNRYTGDLYDYVPNASKPGQMREFTLRDARPLLALPGTTTVLQLPNKPAINKWSVEQAIKAARDFEWVLGSQEEIKEVVQKSEEYLDWTRDFGIATHSWVQSKLTGKPMLFPPLMPFAEEVADGILLHLDHNGYKVERSEVRFYRPDLGYAGTPDIVGTHYGRPCIIDCKTQEPKLTPHKPEYPSQLASYSIGIDLDPAAERVSLIANRLLPGEIYPYIWKDEGATILETNARWDAIWMGMLDLWFKLNRYDPRSE